MSLWRSSAEPHASPTSRRSSKQKTAKKHESDLLGNGGPIYEPLIALAIGGFRALQGSIEWIVCV